MAYGLHDIPTVPHDLPFVGHSVALLRDPLRFLGSLSDHGKLVRVRLGSDESVAVCDRELAREILTKDSIFDKGGIVFDRAREFLGESVGNCPHDSHRRLRRLVQPPFRPACMAGYSPAIVEQVRAVTASWRDGDIIDVPAQMRMLTISALVVNVFADAVTKDQTRTLIEDVNALIKGIFPRMVLPPVFSRMPLPTNRRYFAANDRIRGTIASIVAMRRADDRDHADTLTALLRARDVGAASVSGPHTDALGDDEIADQIVMLFIGGTETCANALSWAFHVLAQEPEIEQRLHDEIDIAHGERDSVAYVDPSNLSLVNRIMTEVMRIYPPAWMISRVVTTDTRVGQYELPEGTQILVSPYVIHHHRDYYPDSSVFDPDRWLPENSGTIPKGANLPFGGGPRRCLGDSFGMTVVTLALATMAADWELRPVDERSVRPALAVTLYPRQLRMRVHRRSTDRLNG